MSRPSARGRWRLSIGQAMILSLIVALCLGPLMAAIRDPRAERILAAVVLDVVAVPTVASAVVLALLERGPLRDWCLKAFWLTPLVFLGLVLTLAVPAIILSALW
jgi:hypothetical protein